MFYYKLSNNDPWECPDRTSTKEELEKKYIGTRIKVGDEPHDVDIIVGIMTEEEANAYFELWD